MNGLKDKDNEQLLRALVRLLNGESLTLRELAALSGISRTTIHMRIKRGWRLGDAVSKPIMTKTEAGKKGSQRSPWRNL